MQAFEISKHFETCIWIDDKHDVTNQAVVYLAHICHQRGPLSGSGEQGNMAKIKGNKKLKENKGT